MRRADMMTSAWRDCLARLQCVIDQLRLRDARCWRVPSKRWALRRQTIFATDIAFCVKRRATASTAGRRRDRYRRSGAEWRQQADLYKDACAGCMTKGVLLVSPFDPLVWHRARTERQFGFRYWLEIYTPAHKGEHDYYVLPFMLDGALVARVDLKADSKAGILIVQRLHVERRAPRSTFKRLIEELNLLASWLALPNFAFASLPAIGCHPATLHGKVQPSSSKVASL